LKGFGAKDVEELNWFVTAGEKCISCEV